MSFTLAFDVTAANYASAPKNYQLAGYDTGPGVAWTPAMWAAHPGAVHIAQSPDLALDEGHTSDVLDCEDGAMAVGSPDIARWARYALASYASAKRPGQRRPALYQSASSVTANVNALVAGGVTSGVGLWIANWSLSTAAAIAELAAASGPFAIIGIQFNDNGPTDSDVFSTGWLDAVSGNGWVFGPVRNVAWTGGITSFSVVFTSPGTPESQGVSEYEIAVCEGNQFTTETASYPRYTPEGTDPQHFQGGSLKSGTSYTAGVRALASGGAHAGPWVAGHFTTGG
jgi:hypothetical protein